MYVATARWPKTWPALYEWFFRKPVVWMPKNRKTFSCNYEYGSLVKFEEKEITRGNDVLSFYLFHRTRGVIRRTFLVSLIVHPTQSLRTVVSNKWQPKITSQHKQHTLSTPSVFFIPQISLIIHSSSLSFSLHQQTYIFTSFDSTLFTAAVELLIRVFMHLRKLFSFAIKFNVYRPFSLLLSLIRL